MFNSIKKNKGITLVALIVTIIILIILAGVSINALIGENGLIGRAKLAKEKQENAQIDEDRKLSDYENEIDKNINGARDETQNSGIQDTVLWTGSISNVGETATLNDSIENYKYILLETKWGSSTAFYDTWLNVNTIKKIGYFATNYSSNNSHSLITMYDNSYIYITFTSNNSLIIPHQDGSAVILTKVIGVK